MNSRPHRASGPGIGADTGRVLILIGFLGVFGFLMIRREPVTLADQLLTLAAFLLLASPYLLFSVGRFRNRFRVDSPITLLAIPAGILLAYLLYLAGPGGFRPGYSLLLVTYIGLPVYLAVRAAGGTALPNRWDWAAAATLYIPVELAMVAPAWEPAAEHLGDPSHSFTQLTAMNLTLFCFLGVRALPGVGFEFRLGWKDLKPALVAFVLFFPLAVVIGVATGFVPFEPHLPDPVEVVGQTLGVLFFVALPEELLFRGILQNFLQRILPTPAGRRWALLAASVLFGLSHLNNRQYFDWRYVTLATLAGLFYGTVYAKTGKVTASAVTHGLVDIVWRVGF
ncbi:MAG: CPBP family intramembrane glutamic endopeptidase [Acidobacteriota bacterium]